MKAAAVSLSRLAVGHGGEDDGDLCLSGGFQELLYLRYRSFEVAGQGRLRVGEPEGHVYDDEGGTAAEAAASAESFVCAPRPYPPFARSLPSSPESHSLNARRVSAMMRRCSSSGGQVPVVEAGSSPRLAPYLLAS